MRRRNQALVFPTVSLLWLLAAPLGFAQSCALCYSQAAGSGSRMIQALRSGILMLVVPPILICVAITWMAYKKRNQFNEDPPSESDSDAPQAQA
jgi:hypothetical protein